MRNEVLLTGATGLLGRYLLKDLLVAGVPVAVVVRPSRRNSPVERVEAIMRFWEEELGRDLPRPQVFTGDVNSENLGLAEEDVRRVQDSCKAVLHNAASLTFHNGGRDAEPWRTNVQGTQNVVDLCQRTGIDEFHHVSTAYTCGLRTGTILETELDEGQSFGNDYERSKVEAEQMVRSTEFFKTPTVYRPSIIIGDSQTAYTSTFHGFYAMLRLIYTLLSSDAFTNEDGIYSSRIKMNGDECKNFVPVDWVSAAIAGILVDQSHHGKTFHLTADTPVSSQTMIDVIEHAIGFTGTVLHGADKPIENPTILEELFYENMQIYEAYWRHDPHFDKTNTEAAIPKLKCPTIDHDLLTFLAKTAIEMGFRADDRVYRSATNSNGKADSTLPSAAIS